MFNSIRNMLCSTFFHFILHILLAVYQAHIKRMKIELIISALHGRTWIDGVILPVWPRRKQKLRDGKNEKIFLFFILHDFMHKGSYYCNSERHTCVPITINGYILYLRIYLVKILLFLNVYYSLNQVMYVYLFITASYS